MLEGGYMLLFSLKEKTKRSGFGQARVVILIWNWNVYTLQSLNDCFELNQFFIVCERFRLWWRWDSLGWLSSMPWRQVTMMSMWPQIFYCHSLSLDQVLLVEHLVLYGDCLSEDFCKYSVNPRSKYYRCKNLIFKRLNISWCNITIMLRAC